MSTPALWQACGLHHPSRVATHVLSAPARRAVVGVPLCGPVHGQWGVSVPGQRELQVEGRREQRPAIAHWRIAVHAMQSATAAQEGHHRRNRQRPADCAVEDWLGGMACEAALDTTGWGRSRTFFVVLCTKRFQPRSGHARPCRGAGSPPGPDVIVVARRRTECVRANVPRLLATREFWSFAYRSTSWCADLPACWPARRRMCHMSPWRAQASWSLQIFLHRTVNL